MADSFSFLRPDLASGDTRSLALDATGLEVVPIRAADHPLFPAAYERLWNEFGSANEMETRDVIAARLAWQPVRQDAACWLRYEMILVRRGQELVAVRDHTAVVTRRPGGAQAVVHLSHVLVELAWRRTGLAGWLRAWPIQTARACLGAAGFPTDSPITLVAEMEHPAPAHPHRLIRLMAYEKAGFRKIAPARVPYLQPDFRAPTVIDASGGTRPLPFGLIVRRVGRETETVMGGAEVREIANSLYQMYRTGIRPQDVAAAERTLSEYPPDEYPVPLVPPTQ